VPEYEHTTGSHTFKKLIAQSDQSSDLWLRNAESIKQFRVFNRQLDHLFDLLDLFVQAADVFVRRVRNLLYHHQAHQRVNLRPAQTSTTLHYYKQGSFVINWLLILMPNAWQQVIIFKKVVLLPWFVCCLSVCEQDYSASIGEFHENVQHKKPLISCHR